MTVAFPYPPQPSGEYGHRGITHLPCPPHNPLNPIDRDAPLGHPCNTCGAKTGQRCGTPCNQRRGNWVQLVIVPGDEHDTNTEDHPPAPTDQWRLAR